MTQEDMPDADNAFGGAVGDRLPGSGKPTREQTAAAYGVDPSAVPRSADPIDVQPAAGEPTSEETPGVPGEVPEQVPTGSSNETRLADQDGGETPDIVVPDDLSSLSAGGDAALAAERLRDLQRLQAEYVNYKKRVDRDREAQRELTIAAVVESLLPVMDEIHLARQHGELDGGPFAKIAEKFEGILAKHGVVRFGENGETFDPMVHQALMHTTADLPPGTTETTVTQVMQPGYKIGERVVRPAMVAVADPH